MKSRSADIKICVRWHAFRITAGDQEKLYTRTSKALGRVGSEDSNQGSDSML